jgi:Domain of unknown function (DUF4388)
MKEVFIVSENEDIFTMFSKTLSYLPVHFSWVGDMDNAEKQFRTEKPDFVFFAVYKLTLLHNWVARYKSFKLRIPFLCFISKIGWEKRELLWMAGAAEVIELPKLKKEFKQIVETVLVSSIDEDNDAKLSGSLNLLNVINLIQTFEDGKKNGVIELISKNRMGQLQFYKGKLVNAIYNNSDPIEAVLAMSLWRDGLYTVTYDKIRHNHRIKLDNRQVIKECQDHILNHEKILSALPDKETVLYASPTIDYEELGAKDRANLLYFKFGKSINEFIENDSDGMLAFLKEIDSWIDKGALVGKEEFQAQQLKIKEEKNKSGVKKLFGKIFSKKEESQSPAPGMIKKNKDSGEDYSEKKVYMFDRFNLLAEYAEILENQDG